MSHPASRILSGSPRLHYLDWNSAGARTIILLHGNSANAWWWRPLADALSGTDYRLLAIDMRGHGDSEWVRPPAYAPADYADDLARLIHATGVEGAIAAGHSMGGIAVLAFTLRYHRLVRAVAAIDVAITSTPRRNRYLARLKTLPTVTYPDLPTAISRFRLMPDEGAIPAEVMAEVAGQSLGRTTDGRYTMKFDRESFFGSDGLDSGAAIRAASVPLLLVRGELSRIMSAEAAAQAAAANPLVELVTIAGAHHHLPLESPVPLARALGKFAARLEP
ncbi:MAG TPA: alpha/beta hydrolase [Candidatus Binataceae bacterium]|nr:alpha/beta hydrolase [Candidatus Binataceae bacterium]